MIVFKNKQDAMLDRISQKLDAAHIDEYEISEDIPEKTVGISADLDNTEIYLPEKLEYFQYDIDDFVRSLGPSLRTTVSVDRDIYRLKIKGRLTETQYFKLIQFLIDDQEEFVTIVKQ